MHKDASVSKDPRKKPNTIVFYDKTKGGVDIVDLRMSKYTTKAKTRRWTLNTFAYILDVSIVNSSTILHDLFTAKHISSHNYIWDLGKQLILPHMTRRAVYPGITSSVMANMRRFINLAPCVDQQEDRHSDCKRCCVCLHNLVGIADYKIKKSKLPKSSRECSFCNKGVCKKHTVYICSLCQENEDV